MQIIRSSLHLGCLLAVLASVAAAAEPEGSVRASRDPEEGCKWVEVQSTAFGASMLVEQCDFGARKIQHIFEGNKLLQKFSDAGEAAAGDTIIEIFTKEESENPEAVLKRLFIDKLDAYEKKHCVVRPANPKEVLESPFQDKSKSAWVIQPDDTYAQKIKRETPKDDMPADSCGDYGLPVDSRSYFEFHAGNKFHFVWVDVGQDTPLFDEQSIKF